MRVVVLAALALVGCTNPPELTGNAEGGVVTYGTRPIDETVHGRGANVAVQMADAHCQRFGRIARMQQSVDRGAGITFVCVARPASS